MTLRNQEKSYNLKTIYDTSSSYGSCVELFEGK
jgi:hypothetical protein